VDELNGLGGVFWGIFGIFVIHVCYFDVRKGKFSFKEGEKWIHEDGAA
jgi:hypothetical protein